MTGSPQFVKIGHNISFTLTLYIGSPQGFVFNTTFNTLYTRDRAAKYSTNSIFNFTNDSAIISQINNNEMGSGKRLGTLCQGDKRQDSWLLT